MRIRGDVITPEDSAYDDARKVYNGSIDKRPAVIVRCFDAADVAIAIAFARAQSLDAAIRGGGHSGAGFGVAEGGLVIDLSPQRWVRVDPEARLVQVGGGCTLADIDHATHGYGLAVPSGTFGTTGIGGLALGGGIGHLTRKFGLTVDHLVEADVVLADTSLVKASETREPGSLLGVARRRRQLRRRHRIHVSGPSALYADRGADVRPLERTQEVMRLWADLISSDAPDDLTGSSRS